MLATAAYQFLAQELRRPEALSYLEIGVFEGDGLAMLAKAFPDKPMTGVDPFIDDGCTTRITGAKQGEPMPDQRTRTLDNLKDLANVTLLEETSTSLYNRLTDQMI